MLYLQGIAPNRAHLANHRRPFSDWLADAQRQCQRRTGNPLAANDAPDHYWLAAYQCGLTAWDAADGFIEESRYA